MLKLLMEGEEIAEFVNDAALQKEIDSLRRDYAIGEEQDMTRWPQDYDPGYSAGDGFDQYFHDLYQIMREVDAGPFLKGK